MTVQLHEEIRLNTEATHYEIAIKLDSWHPVIFELKPQLRSAYTHPLALPEVASDRFLIPLD